MRLYKNKLIQQFITLLFGSLSSFAINLIALYFFAKLYSKEMFGVYALFISIVTLGSLISTLRLENVIVLQKTKKEALFLGSVNLKIVMGLCLFTAAIGLLLFLFQFSFFELNSTNWLFTAISLYTLSVISVMLSWHNKVKNYKIISSYKFIQSLVLALFGIALGYFNFNNGLLIAFTVATVVSSTYLYYFFYLEKRKHQIKKIVLNDISTTIKQHKNYIRNTIGLDFFTQLTKALPNFILQLFFGTNIVGVYDMSLRIISIPKNILSANLGEIYFQKGSVFFLKSTKKFKQLNSNILKWLIVLGVISYLPFIFFGKELFVFVLGEEWLEAGKLSQVMSIWFIFYFITSPMAYIFYINKKTQQLFWYAFISFLIKATALFYISSKNSANASATKYVLICVVLEIILLSFIFFNMKLKKYTPN